VEQREKMSRVLLHSIGIMSSDVNVGRAEYGEILMLTCGEPQWCEILIFILRELQQRHEMQHEIGVPILHLL
jgi:hypothetical protein